MKKIALIAFLGLGIAQASPFSQLKKATNFTLNTMPAKTAPMVLQQITKYPLIALAILPTVGRYWNPMNSLLHVATTCPVVCATSAIAAGYYHTQKLPSLFQNRHFKELAPSKQTQIKVFSTCIAATTGVILSAAVYHTGSSIAHTLFNRS